MAVTRLAPNCRPSDTGDPTHECAGCTCHCHPEVVRVSHGAPITNHRRTRARADEVRRAAGLQPRGAWPRAG